MIDQEHRELDAPVLERLGLLGGHPQDRVVTLVLVAGGDLDGHRRLDDLGDLRCGHAEELPEEALDAALGRIFLDLLTAEELDRHLLRVLVRAHELPPRL